MIAAPKIESGRAIYQTMIVIVEVQTMSRRESMPSSKTKVDVEYIFSETSTSNRSMLVMYMICNGKSYISSIIHDEYHIETVKMILKDTYGLRGMSQVFTMIDGVMCCKIRRDGMDVTTIHFVPIIIKPHKSDEPPMPHNSYSNTAIQVREQIFGRDPGPHVFCFPNDYSNILVNAKIIAAYVKYEYETTGEYYDAITKNDEMSGLLISYHSGHARTEYIVEMPMAYLGWYYRFEE